MPTKKAIQPEDLTPQEGKVLRFFVSRLEREQQTAIDDCIVETPWSDLPKTHWTAVRVTGRLKAKGLLKAAGKGKCSATEAGISLMKAANRSHVWQTAPPPRITNPKKRA
jgi:hypothetical protein